MRLCLILWFDLFVFGVVWWFGGGGLVFRLEVCFLCGFSVGLVGFGLVCVLVVSAMVAVLLGCV